MGGRKAQSAPKRKRTRNNVLKELLAEFGTEEPRREPLWKRIVSDEEWAELQRLSGLPREARNRVAQSIIIYQNSKDSPPGLPPAQTRSQLEQTARQADRLITSIDQLYDNDTAFGVLIDRKGWDLVRLEHCPKNCVNFATFLQARMAVSGNVQIPARAMKICWDWFVPSHISYLKRLEHSCPSRRSGAVRGSETSLNSSSGLPA